MQTIQLYIDNKRLDMFEDESVELTSSIQDVRDISKIFTDYSQSFTVPASKNNNKIFAHYYDNAIVDGYDARFRSNAEIQLNHTPFRKGTIRLNKVLMKSNKAYAYELTFFGSTATLSRILGEKRLNSLTTLTAYNHDWNYDNVKLGLESGLTVGTDTKAIIYPLISPNKRFIYNSNGFYVTPENYRNLGNNSDGEGLFKGDLKPAIRAVHIIEAIEAQYPELQFSRDFFGEDVFNELYLWLNREAGELGNSKGKYEVEKGILLGWTGPTTGDDYFKLDGNDTVELGAIRTNFGTESSTFQLNIETDSSEPYDIVVYNTVTDLLTNGTNRSVLYEYKGLSGNQSVSETILPGANNFNKVFLQFEVKSFAAMEFTSTLDLGFYRNSATVAERQYSAGDSDSGVVSTLDFVDVAQEMPNIKIIDFLTGIFKMFNLTAYVEDDVIVVKDLNTFYSDDYNTYDVTEYMDVTTSSVKRLDLYSNIKYEFKEPSTRLAVKFDQLFDFPFGNEEFNVVINNKYIDGIDYLVQLPFEKVIYEKLLDDNDEVYTNIQYGYFVSENDEPIKGSPLLFYNCNTSVDAGKPLYLSADDGLSRVSVATYNRPSNVKEDGTQTLNFDAENDEFTVGLTTPSYNENSLFRNYHEDYINNIFDIQSRMLEVSALLPIKILHKYKLNDRFVINGKQYTINKVSSNLMSGRSNLELISELVEPFVQPRNIIIAFGSYTSGLDVPINIVTYGGCDSATIQWSTDPAFPGGGTPVSAGCSGETVVTMPSYGTFYYRAFSIDANDPSNTAISNIISKTITQATYYTPEVLKFGATDVLACSGSNLTLYVSSADGLYYDSDSGSGDLVNGSFYSDGTKVYTFVDGVKNEVGYCFSYSAQTFKYSAVQQDSCSGADSTLYYNPQDGLYYTAGDGTGTLFTGSYYSNGNFIYSFTNGVKTQVATCDTFTSESYTYDANANNACDSTLVINLYISSNDGLYYFTTSGIGSPVDGGYYVKDGNVYTFSNGVRSLFDDCQVPPTQTFYSLERCSDGNTGFRSNQETSQISLSVNDRVRDNSFTNYIVSGDTTTGTNVGQIYDTGLRLCPSPPSPGSFVTVWDTRNTLRYSSGYNQVELGLDQEGVYDFSVDWGDGNVETITSYSQRTHTYDTPGIYEIRMTGHIFGWLLYFDRAKLLSVKQWGTLTFRQPTVNYPGGFFANCYNLDLSEVSDVLDLTGVSSCMNMFGQASSLTTINRINEWDMSNVQNIASMFANCPNLDINISNWNVENVFSASNFMVAGKLSTSNLDAIYNSWGYQNLKNGVSISFANSQYSSAGVAGRNELSQHWTITDGGLEI